MCPVRTTGVTATFTYDGEGRRVTKSGGGTTLTFVYGPDGQLAAQYGGTAQTAGRKLVTRDHLGSTRLVTQGTAAVGCHDYMPFGEEVAAGWTAAGVNRPACYGAAGTVVKFTGKERDAETALDYFEARYLSSAQGRFSIPDPDNYDARLEQPQSWNMLRLHME